jgi:uncharacterized protein YkwD
MRFTEYPSSVRAVLLLLLIGGACAANPFPSAGKDDPPKSASRTSELTTTESELYALINQERKQRDLPLFALDNHLIAAARQHTEATVRQGKLSHQFPGEPVLRIRLARAGARFDAVAENVAESDSVRNAHVELMHSTGHRANLLNPNYNAVGIGIVETGDKIWVTEDFSHRVPEQTAENVERLVVKQVNQIRSNYGLAALKPASTAKLRELACQPGITARAVWRDIAVSGVTVIFTQSDATNLPEQLKKAAVDPTVKNIAIGVCYPPESQEGFAMFTGIVVLYR